MTAVEFIGAQPGEEFAPLHSAQPAAIPLAIAAAEQLVSEASHGGNYSWALRLKTCQLLAISPGARDMKLVMQDGRTIYDAQMEMLEAIAACGSGRVI